MELCLASVNYDANVWEVKRAIGGVLHSDDFFDSSDPKARPINFKVTLGKGHGGVQNNGMGTLILPSRKIGDKFMKWIGNRKHKIAINGCDIRVFRPQKPSTYGLSQIGQTLEKTPYLAPELEEEREVTLGRLDVGIHVSKIQFGVYYRGLSDDPTRSRTFSNEYEISHSHKGAGLLSFEYEHKLIRIELGDRMLEEICHNIAITFSNIRKYATGLDFGNPFICFDLFTPPMFERQRFNREFSQEWKDLRKFRQRIDSVNEAHAVVAPYAHHIRLIMHQEQDVIAFAKLCRVAGLPSPVRANIDSYSRGFFSPKQLSRVIAWVRTFDWAVAFQIEALLRNGLLNTEELLVHLYQHINDLYRAHRDVAGHVLRQFSEALRSRDSNETPLQCFHRVLSRNLDQKPMNMVPGQFPCHHVTFTPTRIVLEGPYVIQSNRVIRQYFQYHEYFLRVDFRDEDRLQYRWSRDVDGASLLTDRVGGILKNGFYLGGRHFEFLAYSQSALREHAVWFICPFNHPTEGYVTGQKIRDSLGDFSGVIKYPSKYAARIAQAFTATDPSVRITRDQWEEMPDMGEEPYLYTDGVGTISPELGDMIWKTFRQSHVHTIQPDAYQIRFLGYKGMVVVDRRLKGIKMRLRKSMNKFKSRDEESAEIEIARFFNRPGTTYLNRPLVMILEDRGVEKQAFLNLQNKAKEAIFTAGDSIDNSVQLLRAHRLGMSYRLAFILQSLKKIGMGMQREETVNQVDDDFIQRLIQYGKNHVLRDIKHSARIPIPESYLLVGVADEGPAYKEEGCENVFMLEEGQIYACIQNPDDPEPTYIKGSVTISRSPVVHPGDVQRVWAIGKPPNDGICFFRGLKNVVVLPSVGSGVNRRIGNSDKEERKRSLASCLGGGDLDGDLYSVIKYGSLLPADHEDPAEYPPVGTRALEHGGDSTVDDICDFIVEYINSDVLGLLSDRHLVIADQSKYGTKDDSCLELAALCSQAVDYAKNGVPVDIHDSPRYLIPYKPDWHKAEDADPRSTDYYESNRALGDLFRNITITIPSPSPPPSAVGSVKPLSDSVSGALKPYIERHLRSFRNHESSVGEMHSLFKRYVDELRYICMTHALSDAPEVRLSEEEVVVGTILAQCSQTRWRSDRTYRMRLHASVLVQDIQEKLFKRQKDVEPSRGELSYGLSQAWLAWDFATRNTQNFGARSFGLIALGAILDVLDLLGELPAA